MRKASFRGIEFEVTDRSWTSGRRVQKHEYPNKEVGWVEDLGKKMESFPITAFVIGDNYEVQRDALKEACCREGPGILVHPDYGSIEVVCESISVKETVQRRTAVFELTFCESGEKGTASISMDYSENVVSASSTVSSISKESFVQNFVLPSSIDELTSLVGSVGDVCSSAIDDVSMQMNPFSEEASEVKGSLSKLVDASGAALDLKTDAQSLLNTPDALAAQIDAVFSAVSSLSGKSTNSFKTVRQLSSASHASEKAIDSNDEALAEKKAMQQVEALTKQLVVAKEAELMTQIDFEAAEEATSFMNMFLEDVEEIETNEEMEPTTEVVQTLRDLREAVVAFVREIVLELPRTRTIQMPDKIPSLVLAYDLYEDLSRADEIVKKNKIQHPAFVPANTDLKVLSE